MREFFRAHGLIIRYENSWHSNVIASPRLTLRVRRRAWRSAPLPAPLRVHPGCAPKGVESDRGRSNRLTVEIAHLLCTKRCAGASVVTPRLRSGFLAMTCMAGARLAVGRRPGSEGDLGRQPPLHRASHAGGEACPPSAVCTPSPSTRSTGRQGRAPPGGRPPRPSPSTPLRAPQGGRPPRAPERGQS
jgi:hypothetical protein